MNEFEDNSAEQADELERTRALETVIEQYLEADEEFLAGHSLSVKIGLVYGMLLELGEDPEIILHESGVLKKENNGEV